MCHLQMLCITSTCLPNRFLLQRINALLFSVKTAKGGYMLSSASGNREALLFLWLHGGVRDRKIHSYFKHRNHWDNCAADDNGNGT